MLDPAESSHQSSIPKCSHGLYLPQAHVKEGRSPFCYGCRAEARLIIHNFDDMRASRAVRALNRRRKRND